MFYEDAILQSIVNQEYDEEVGSPCGCKSKSPRLYRCRDCGRIDVVCKSCLLERHRFVPYHWAEEWSGRHFKRMSMSALGLQIHLGHGENHCPAVEIPKTQAIDVVHSNGIHKCRFIYCSCPGKPDEFVQLLDVGLLSASMKQPQTAFTFAVLNDFHLDTGVSKKAAHDFMEVLRKKTNNHVPFPVSVDLIRRSLLLISPEGSYYTIQTPFLAMEEV